MPEIESPSAVYIAGRQEWNERYGSYITRERWWRRIAVVALLTSAGLGASNMWQASQSHVVPYVIEVNKLGEAVTAHKLVVAPPIDTGRIKAQLAKWIVDTRSVYSDPYAELNIVTEAYAWTDRQSDALAQLDGWFRASNPNERAKKETVGVTIDSVGQIGADTWQVDFAEEHRAKDGTTAFINYWRATLKIKVVPTTEDTILENPNGVFVTWQSITQRMR